MNERPSRIEPVKLEKITHIGDRVMPDKDKIMEDNPGLPEVPKPFYNDAGQLVVAPKKMSKVQTWIVSIRTKIFKTATQKLVDFFIGWLLTFAIYKKDGDGNVVVNPKGEPVVLWMSTVLTAILSFVSAATLAKEAFLGKTWGEVIEIILANLPL
jgi:hypothetical protein